MANSALVDHYQQLKIDFANLWLNPDFSDVLFTVDQNEHIPCHKLVLAVRSEYFRALLYNGMVESSKTEIRLNDTPGTAFKEFLRYIYTGTIDLSMLDMTTVIDLLGISHKFGMTNLENAVSMYLKSQLKLENVAISLKTALFYSNEQLLEDALQYIDENAEDFLRIPDFTSLESELLELVLKRDSFSANEDSIFHYVKEWFEKNKDLDKEHHMRVLRNVRFSVVNPEGAQEFEVKTGVIWDLINQTSEPRLFEPTENVATIAKGAEIVAGRLGENAEVNCLIDGDTSDYGGSHGFYAHTIGEPDESITLKLDRTYMLRSIAFLLYDHDSRYYSYYVETSLNGQDWTRVVDHTEKKCQSWQRLEFRRRPVRFIKIVGTESLNCEGGINQWLHVVHFECPWQKREE